MRLPETQIKTHRAPAAEDSLACDFQRAVVERFPSGEVNVSAVCIAASGIMAAYLAALPDETTRAALLEKVVDGLQADLNSAPTAATSREIQ
jgi:hypothetical protein